MQYDFLAELFRDLKSVDGPCVAVIDAHNHRRIINDIDKVINDQRFARHGYPVNWPATQDLPTTLTERDY